MPPKPDADGRPGKLRKLFKDVLAGRRKVSTSSDAKLFIEAILVHESPSVCVETLATSPSGLEAIRISTRADLSISFLQSHVMGLLLVLSTPEIKALAEGQLLSRLLHVIVNPPTVWKELVDAFVDKQLEEQHWTPFAWLTYELLTSSQELELDILSDAQIIIQTGRLLQSTTHSTRELAYKIDKVLQLKTASLPTDASFSPGGRHDNDFVDFRQIAIYPTPDELLSDEAPFYRRAREVYETPLADRVAVHLDNQFRLLREDMLADLREDRKLVFGKKRGRRAGLVLYTIRCVSIEMGNEHRGKSCSLAVTCEKGLERMQKLNPENRRKYLKENKNFLKHQSLGALFQGDEVCGFAFVDRDEDMLCEQIPIVCLQFTDSRSLGKGLLALKSDNVNFMLVDSPVFAYEPILNQLKVMDQIPLQDILLDVEGSQSQEAFNVLEETLDLSQPHLSRIMVISFTNHALDQFLEELLDAGIPANAMVRLGSKSTDRTSALMMPRNSYANIPSECRGIIADLKGEQYELREDISHAFTTYYDFMPSFQAMMDHLEFSQDDRPFYDAFTVPHEDQKWKRVGAKGREVRPDYLFSRWQEGRNPGMYTRNVPKELEPIWNMEHPLRLEYIFRWRKEMVLATIEDVETPVQKYDAKQRIIDSLYNLGKLELLKSKRVIACTTTAAAMQQKLICAANPDVILVEEAGEILECHILASMAPSVKQLILIGDHKQLRPKANNHALSVEKGAGFDLNRSLLERLILQGFEYTRLREQHRMHPDISCFPRALTYPDLEDGPKTMDRPMIEGLRDRLMFINHEHPETQLPGIVDSIDAGIKASKQNEFEAAMVLKMVRYLAQQGYGTNKMVVLTPYLGQLRLLSQRLEEENDPVLNDLDASALIQAGLMTQAASKVGKRPLRISTIGEKTYPYQLRGNMDTFMAKGNATWVSFFEMLKERGHLYDGFPVLCERHPETSATLQGPDDFDKYCPDGGCAKACNSMLRCGLHKQHKRRVMCNKKDEVCSKCIHEDKEQERRIWRDLDLELERNKRQAAYNKELIKIQDEIDHQRRIMKNMTETEAEKKALEQQKQQLKDLKQTTSRMAEIKKAQAAASVKTPQKTNEPPKPYDLSSLLDGAQAEWEYSKQFDGARNDYLDELMGMIGLEEVKQTFLEIKGKVDTKVRQNVPLSSERFNCSLLGNPGTGKTTVARLYASFLTSVGVLPGSRFEETTGSKLANLGVTGCQKLVEDVLNDGGGVIFIDEAYQLTSGNSYGGGAVLDYLLPEVENLTGKIVFVLAGYNKQMESFFSHNPGLPSRFPFEMKFADYTDQELLQILGLKITKQYKGAMKCEDGLDGLFCRIVARRVGRGRGREGFGNARTIENTLAEITQRQATRLTRQRRAKRKPDDLLLTKEDIIGPEPSEALAKSAGWKKLNTLIGLKSVKQAVRALVSSVEQNYQRELAEQPPIEYSLNKVFLGNPGTGKTTVAKLYGQILADLGLLSKGEVIIKNPSDFVGAALGQSEQQTKGILAASLGKVLVIDEAYGLYGGGGTQGSSGDPYKTAVVDTIVAEVQSVPGDDRCVLLLGYKNQIETMFQNVNPGLARRFPLSSAFEFEDFDDGELGQILSLKLNQQAFKATGQARDVAMEILGRARNRPHFGNAGEIDILLDAAKARHQLRLTSGATKLVDSLEPVDFDKDFDRAQSAETDVRKLFEGTVGSEEIINLLLGYQDTVRSMKTIGLDPKEHIPFNFLFRGPPGTGKTTTARKMGKVFYDMGFLATAELVECSATDLIGQYVGQTGPKVHQLLDKALGKVLFIDEAYRLADGGFATEAVNELVDSVTKVTYERKLVIILAGYESDINRLMSINEGLTSRFPEVINFRSLSPEECMVLLRKILSKQKEALQLKGISFDLNALDLPSPTFTSKVTQLFSSLSKQPSWASARDVGTVAQKIFMGTLQDKARLKEGRLVVEEHVVISKLEDLFKERESRSQTVQKSHLNELKKMRAAFQVQDAPKMAPNITKTSTTTCAETSEPPKPEPEPEPAPAPQQIETVKQDSRPRQSSDEAKRDAGVSDAIWEQLRKDKQAEQDREDEYRRLLEEKNKATDAARDRIIKKILEEERRREEEAAMQKKLQEMGACPVGYHVSQRSELSMRGLNKGLEDTDVPVVLITCLMISCASNLMSWD
ncbi:hypothetical protein SLS62_004601 [Diatrype stigma]|uniref:AAA+ ATPase domain-containing protein n=1 Tax=Diatrype stigma TaxID=117547 RepID=A0AAN9UU87_9PEZI